MIYLVEVKTTIPGMTKKHVVTRGFACTRAELPQELATHLGVKKIDIVDVGLYSSSEAAHMVAKAHNG